MADDHSTIGAILGALLVPAIFWKRARAVHREFQSGFMLLCYTILSFAPVFLGGAGIGAGLGLTAHWIRNFTEERLPEGPIAHNPIQNTSTENPTMSDKRS